MLLKENERQLGRLEIEMSQSCRVRVNEVSWQAVNGICQRQVMWVDGNLARILTPKRKKNQAYLYLFTAHIGIGSSVHESHQ